MKPKTHESILHRFFLGFWYQNKPTILARCLYPLGRLFFFLASSRRARLSAQAKSFSVPVVVVGNISIGGTGKTPLIIALANKLKEQGVNVGIVSRGYGSHMEHYPFEVNSNSHVSDSGDEALLMAMATQSTVVIDPNRVNAVNHLLAAYPATQLVLSDDGLQHYRLHRDFEIIVVDGKKGIGNGFGLPAGPLREPKERIAEVDMVCVNGEASPKLNQHLNHSPYESIWLQPTLWSPVGLATNKKIQVGEPLPWQGSVVAIAAIGNPQRFYDTLNSLGVDFISVAFDDHHQFTQDDFMPYQDQTIVMTAKDAVKCRDFASENWWQLEVECVMPNTIIDSLKTHLR